MKRKKLGNIGEELASKYLESQGYKVLHRNYRTKMGEIDIIAEKNGTTYFVEVRSINNTLFAHPAQTLSPAKLNHLRKAIYMYLALHKTSNYRTLFVGIDFTKKPPEISTIEDFLEE